MKTKETKQLNKDERFKRLSDIARFEYHAILWTIATQDPYNVLESRLKHFKIHMRLLACFAKMRGHESGEYEAYNQVRWDW